MKGSLALVLLLLVGCASQESPLESRFQKADADGDGVVARKEATNMMIAEVFPLYDTNGDGYVNEAEFVASGGDAAKFKSLTKSTGGQMSLAEAQSTPEAVEVMAVPFDEADTNGDGSLSLAEAKAYVAKVEAIMR